MTARFSIGLVLHGIPTVRHIRDIEESIRLAIQALASLKKENLRIESARVDSSLLAGALMTIAFAAQVDVHDIQHDRQLRNVEESIRRNVSALCCQRDDALSVSSVDTPCGSGEIEKRPPGSESFGEQREKGNRIYA